MFAELQAVIAQLQLGLLPVPGSTSAVDVNRLGRLNGTSLLDLTYAGTPNPNTIRFGSGNAVSFYPALSGIKGPPNGSTDPAYFDHQRASLLVSSVTQDDAHAEEQTLAVTTTIGTGYAPLRQSNTAYALGANVVVGNAVYRATQAGTTGTISPPGTRPTSLPFVFNDGTVKWMWINDAAINAKLAAYFEAMAVPGAGQVWGTVTNLQLMNGVVPTFAAAHEVDFANNSGTDCAPGVANGIGVFVRMVGTNQSTSGLAMEASGTSDGRPSALFGARFAGPVAANATISLGTTGGQSGIGIGDFTAASYTVAAINDGSTAPAGVNIAGTKSLTGIRVAVTAPAAIDVRGGNVTNQILADGFIVSKTGIIIATFPTSATGLPSGAVWRDAANGNALKAVP